MNFAFDLLYRAFNHGRNPQQRREHKKQQEFAEEEQRVLSQRPRPLPTTRIDIFQSNLCQSPAATTQPDCFLLTRLPSEIRHRIWTEVVGGHIIHITHVDRDLRAFILRAPTIDEDEGEHNKDGGSTDVDQRDFHTTALLSPPIYPPKDPLPSDGPPFASPPFLLSLPLTAHIIYAESLPLIYTANTFAFTSPLPLIYMHSLPTIPHDHFRLITSLQLHWTYFLFSKQTISRTYGEYAPDTWSRFWTTVAEEMPRLKRLGAKVDLWVPHGREDDEEAKWAKPMMQVRGLEQVECRLGRWIRPSERIDFDGLAEKVQEVWTSPREQVRT